MPPKHTKTGYFLEQLKPLASRSILVPPNVNPRGRVPFVRLGGVGPTPKLQWTGREIAARFGPSVHPEATFFLDTGIFSSHEDGPLWDLFLRRQILIPPSIWIELGPWIQNPRKNTHIRDLVLASVRRQLAGRENSEGTTDFFYDEGGPWSVGIKVRTVAGRYQLHGQDYYCRLLTLRKLIGKAICASMERELGRPPSDEEFHAEAQRVLGERGYQFAKKGRDWVGPGMLDSDEQLVVAAFLTAIMDCSDVYIITRDTDILDQFVKLRTLIREHYRAMHTAERFASDPLSLPFREVSPLENDFVPSCFVGTTVLEMRMPETQFKVLPQNFHSVIVHCLLLGGARDQPSFSYACANLETEMAQTVKVKATKGGRSTDKFGDHNCTIRTAPFNHRQHEVVATIGKERTVKVGGNEFGLDDYVNVLFRTEAITHYSIIQPQIIVLPSSAYTS